MQAAGLDLDARSHGGRNRDALDIGALGARRFCLGDRIGKRLDVLHQLLFRERGLADTGLNDARLLGITLSSLGEKQLENEPQLSLSF